MHTLIVIIGIIATAAAWWYRIQYMHRAAKDISGAVSKMRGKNGDKQTTLPSITTIADPVHAAATLMTAIATEERAMTPQIEARLRTAIGEIAPAENIDAAVDYAKLATQEATDVPYVVDQLARFLETQLNGTEKVHLIELVQDVAGADTPPARFIDRLRLLRRKLGLVVN